jgi:hypothetical protein
MCKNELFKVQGRKTELMYSLRTKTIFGPKRIELVKEGIQSMPEPK